jgi:hypothetical protein
LRMLGPANKPTLSALHVIKHHQSLNSNGSAVGIDMRKGMQLT